MPVHYIYLIVAVVAETIGTSALQASQQFSKVGPSILTVVGYAVSFYFLSLALRVMPVGIVYAIWSGLGIVMIAIIGRLVFQQRLDWPAIVGMGFIIGGIVIIQLFSKSAHS